VVGGDTRAWGSGKLDPPRATLALFACKP
jgi:hypothetical protein